MLSTPGVLTCLLVIISIFALLVALLSWIQRPRRLEDFNGPFLARYTDWWKTWVMLFEDREEVYQRMHQIYGDTFQDGPNSLVTCNPEASRHIYMSRDMPKSSKFNSNTLSESSSSVFFALDTARHFMYRREINKAFKLESILLMEDRIDTALSEFLSILKEKSGTPIDFSWYSSLLCFDLLFDLMSGERKGFLKKRGDCNGIIEAFHSPMFNFLAVDPIPIFSKIMFSDAVQKFAPEDKGFVFVNKLVVARVEDYFSSKARSKHIPDSVLKFLLENKKHKISRKRATDELFNSWIAGFDTTSTTISTCVQYILSNPSVHARVLEECSALPEDVKYTDMSSNLKYLDACISETMRLKPTNSNTFPRTVQDDGMLIGGRYVPEGTSIAPNINALGRSSRLYSDPYAFNPERWLAKKQPAAFFFGMGPRECVGKHLAWTVVKKALFRLFKDFGTGIKLEKEGVEIVRVLRVHEGMMVKIEEQPEKAQDQINRVET